MSVYVQTIEKQMQQEADLNAEMDQQRNIALADEEENEMVAALIREGQILFT